MSIQENTEILELPGTKPFEVTCNVVKFADKTVVSVLKDGETDVSYDIPMPSISERRRPVGGAASDDDELLDNAIIPRMLVGSNYDIKTQVAASQIGKLLLEIGGGNNAILNMSGKLFRGDKFEENDFKKLQFVVKLVRDTLTA